MGVQIYDSREIGSSRRIPVPGRLNKVLRQDTSGSAGSSFWHYQRGLDLPLLADRPLFSSSEFEYVGESEYLGERKSNGDWDIRPRRGVVENTSSDFDGDQYAFFLLKEDWLNTEPFGVYILTSTDLPHHLPALRRLQKHYPQFFDGDSNSGLDMKRPQEGGQESSFQVRTLLKILEQTGMTDVQKLVNQIYTVGQSETQLELPAPSQK